MEVIPDKNGILVVRETEFEKHYLDELFTLNESRKVTYDHNTGCLKITAIPRSD